MAQRVLFVCTGNSCRSVMAQGLLQQQLNTLAGRLREPVEVESAGIAALEGVSPTRETLRLLLREGIDLSGHMARMLTNEMIEQATLILVMEPHHDDDVIRRVPSARAKTHLLKTYGISSVSQPIDPSVHVPDPIGKPAEVYEACFATIREAVTRVAQSLVTSSGGS